MACPISNKKRLLKSIYKWLMIFTLLSAHAEEVIYKPYTVAGSDYNYRKTSLIQNL